jgi:hypothetical protein
MQELRLLFAKPTTTTSSWDVSLTDGDGKPIGVPVPFEPFLKDTDYDDLRWYLEEYIEMPDGGALVRAQWIETNYLTRVTRCKTSIFYRRT